MKTTLSKGVMVLDELPKNCEECKFCAPLQGEKLEQYNKLDDFDKQDLQPYECLAKGYAKSLYNAHLIRCLDIRPTRKEYLRRDSRIQHESEICPFMSEKDNLVHYLDKITGDIEFDRIYSEEE